MTDDSQLLGFEFLSTPVRSFRPRWDSGHRFSFGNIVIVDQTEVGVIVKSWAGSITKPNHYDVYVRSYNGIKEYLEQEISPYPYEKSLEADFDDDA